MFMEDRKRPEVGDTLNMYVERTARYDSFMFTEIAKCLEARCGSLTFLDVSEKDFGFDTF